MQTGGIARCRWDSFNHGQEINLWGTTTPWTPVSSSGLSLRLLWRQGSLQLRGKLGRGEDRHAGHTETGREWEPYIHTKENRCPAEHQQLERWLAFHVEVVWGGGSAQINARTQPGTTSSLPLTSFCCWGRPCQASVLHNHDTISAIEKRLKFGSFAQSSWERDQG